MSGRTEAMNVQPIPWRAVAIPLLQGVAAAACVALVLSVIRGSWSSFWPLLVGGSIGFAVAFALPSRSKPVELDGGALCGPSAWGRRTRIAFDEVDWRAQPRPGRPASLLGGRVVRARDGRSVVIDRWRYRPRELRRLEAELDRLTGERGRGA